MAHDEGGLRVIGRVVVETFHGRHLAPLFADLNSISEADVAIPDGQRREESEHQSEPSLGEGLEPYGVGVKEVQEAAIDAGAKRTRADQAGHAGQVAPSTKAQDHGREPAEGHEAGAGWEQEE
jgi:hypothetical protein